MQLSAADQTAIIASLGETITLAGTAALADFRTESTPVVMYDGSVMGSSPTARITAAELAAHAVTYGSTVVARGVSYTVTEIRQEQSGLVLLALTKA